MALCVFFCHVFEDFNNFGFLFVSVFFFMSGYGMEFASKRDSALTRLVPYLGYFLWFSFIYFLFFRVFPYPSSWFLIVYFLVMVLYRLFSNIYALAVAFVLLGVFFITLEFNFVWYASFWSFLFGVYFAKNPSSFTLRNSLCFLPVFFLIPYVGPVSLMAFLPLFSWLVLTFCSWNVFRRIAYLGRYSFHFYCVHCFLLGVFGVTWTLGGSPEFWGVLLAFSLSVFFSMFFKDYLFRYPNIK